MIVDPLSFSMPYLELILSDWYLGLSVIL